MARTLERRDQCCLCGKTKEQVRKLIVGLHGAVCIDVSRDGDQITQMNGKTAAIRPGDMIMRDAGGVSCSVLYGQDNRSPISPTTSHVLYVSYAPSGVDSEAVERQLESVEALIRLWSPAAVAVRQDFS